MSDSKTNNGITDENQNPNPEEKKELTEEEILAMRTNMINFYKEQIDLIKPQAEYEMLLADIEEARLRKLSAKMRYAQLIASVNNPPPPEGNEKHRKLKKEE